MIPQHKGMQSRLAIEGGDCTARRAMGSSAQRKS